MFLISAVCQGFTPLTSFKSASIIAIGGKQIKHDKKNIHMHHYTHITYILMYIFLSEPDGLETYEDLGAIISTSSLLTSRVACIDWIGVRRVS